MKWVGVRGGGVGGKRFHVDLDIGGINIVFRGRVKSLRV